MSHNIATQTIKIQNSTYARSIRDKIFGLLFTTKPYPLYFQTRWGIHSFAMSYPIDIVIMDDQWVVQVTKESFFPWGLFFWNPAYKRVLELPIGTIQKKKIRPGTIVHLS